MNDYAPLDVVLAGVRVKGCVDPRPCVVVGSLSNDEYLIMPCSSQMDLYKEGIDFLIPDTHADFKSSGLSRESYVINDNIFQIESAMIRKRYGRLEGALALAFKNWLQ